MYLLDTDAAGVDKLRAELDRIGDSLVVAGGERQWNVHVHTDDAGTAIEAGHGVAAVPYIHRGEPVKLVG